MKNISDINQLLDLKSIKLQNRRNKDRSLVSERNESFADAAIRHSRSKDQVQESSLLKTYRPIPRLNANTTPAAKPINLGSAAPIDNSLLDSFSKGEIINGQYSDGFATTSSGVNGRYQSTTGGQIQYKLGQAQGILHGNKGFSYFADSDQIFLSDVSIDGKNFSLANTKAVDFKTESQSPIFFSSKIDSAEAKTDNLSIKFGTNGQVEVSMLGANGQTIKGQGFYSQKNQALVVAMEDGQTYQARAVSDGESFTIYQPQLVG